MTDQDFQVNANGFVALEPRDGFRKDNSLWFAKCSECGEGIHNSRLVGKWEHTIYIERGWFSIEAYEQNQHPNTTRSYSVDYCPKVTGEVVECENYISANGVRVVIPA